MSATEDPHAYWIASSQPAEVRAKPSLHFDIIADIQPLSVQLGASVVQSVPDILGPPLFDNIDQTVWKTFAILDAAKVIHLAEMLETSGLDHQCLFSGRAYDDLRDVAPWIVELDAFNSFTRRLFTKSDEPWHLWDNEPGIFIRSTSTLEELRSHFRKFTRVTDNLGKWFYFRFWEGSQIARLINNHALEPTLVKLCGEHKIIWRHLDKAYVVSRD